MSGIKESAHLENSLKTTFSSYKVLANSSSFALTSNPESVNTSYRGLY